MEQVCAHPLLKVSISFIKMWHLIFTQQSGLSSHLLFYEAVLSYIALNYSLFHHQSGGNEICQKDDWSPTGPNRSSFALP